MTDSFYLESRVAELYDAAQAGREITEADIPFYVELAKEAAAAGQAVLELACGTGRVTLPIAAAGVEVVGLDSSPAMLAVARRKAGATANPRWVEADMAGFELDQRFGLVVIPFRSFLLLLTVEAQKACLDAIHRHLLPGGRLALNFFNPDLVLSGEWPTTRRGSLQRLASVKEAATGGATSYWQSNVYETARQQLDHTRVEEELTDAGAVISRVYRNLRMRYVFRHEMEHVLALCGFEVEALYGWFDRRPFMDESSEMLWIARRE